MKRVLLDTNIYGAMVVDPRVHDIKERCKHNPKMMIYGFPLIRKELRATPKNTVIEGKKLRIALLSLYDQIVGNHVLQDKKELNSLALEYHAEYKKLGGVRSLADFHADLLIVACASVHRLDIVVSNDDASMLSELAITAYSAVNKLHKLKMPAFIDYPDFVSALRWPV